MERLLYDTGSLDETLERWFMELEFREQLGPNLGELVPVEKSLDRITKNPVFAEVPSPSFYAASVDGIALLSSRTFSVRAESPLRLKIGEDAHFVDTGSIMPKGTDAVVPIEFVKFPAIDHVDIHKFAAPWENVRPLGEEVAARELILPAYHQIRPLDVSALYLGGVTQVDVVKCPRVGILPIGSGYQKPGTKLAEGKVYETSAQMIAGMVKKAGGEPVVMDIVPETHEALVQRSQNPPAGLNLLVIISGPSRGTRPIARLINHLGELVSYGMMVKPGMSACLGIVEKTPIIGLPRYPLSTFKIFQLFGLPVIYGRLGMEKPSAPMVEGYLSREITSPQGVDEFIRVSMGQVEDMPVVVPLSRGAHILMSLVRSDGIMRVEAGTKKMDAGQKVNVEMLHPGADIRRKILISGTHDICFDILRNEFQKQFPRKTLLLSNVGSMRGLMSLKAGYCHGASIHMFDDESGQFNIPLVKKFLHDVPLILVNLFHRKLGFIVERGNPKNISGFHDLTRPDVSIMNRIRGSGTRMIFDYHLRQKGIDINQVRGYSHEAHTHLNLASAVAAGQADAGLGILEAAKATGLDFIPVVPERLDLVIPKVHLSSYPLRCLLQVVNSDEFRREVDALGGYDSEMTGKILFEK